MLVDVRGAALDAGDIDGKSDAPNARGGLCRRGQDKYTAAECGEHDAFLVCGAGLVRDDERGIRSGSEKPFATGKRASGSHKGAGLRT